MLNRLRPTKLSVASFGLSLSCIGGIPAARAIMTTPDPCAAEMAAYVAAYDAWQDALDAETDAAYAAQEAETAALAAYDAWVACEGSGGGSGYMEAPTHELAVSILED